MMVEASPTILWSREVRNGSSGCIIFFSSSSPVSDRRSLFRLVYGDVQTCHAIRQQISQLLNERMASSFQCEVLNPGAAAITMFNPPFSPTKSQAFKEVMMSQIELRRLLGSRCATLQ
jgi:hypothetical protein